MTSNFSLDGGSASIDFTTVQHGDTVIFSDVDADEPLKTFVAPFDFEVIGIRIEYTCSATAGTRLIRWEIRGGSPTDIYFSHQLSVEPTANQVHAFEISPTVNITAGTEGGTTDSFMERCPRVRVAKDHAFVFTVGASDTDDDMIIHIRGIAT